MIIAHAKRSCIFVERERKISDFPRSWAAVPLQTVIMRAELDQARPHKQAIWSEQERACVVVVVYIL